MENFVETHKLINLWLNIFNIVVITLGLWLLKRWISKVVGLEVCRMRQAECQKDRDKYLASEYVPRRELEGQLNIIEKGIEHLGLTVHHMSEHLINHINGRAEKK